MVPANHVPMPQHGSVMAFSTLRAVAQLYTPDFPTTTGCRVVLKIVTGISTY